MRVVIDARFYGSIGKGLGRYTQKLIEYLEKIPENPEGKSRDEFLVLLKKENFDEYIPQKANFQKVLADLHWYSWEEQIKLPGLIKKLQPDVVHFPHFNVPLFYRGKFVVTIHDLILLHFPTLRGSFLNPLIFYFKYLSYRLVIFQAIKKAEEVITVSHFTQNDILKNYPLVRKKINVTWEACDEFCWYQKEAGILEKYGIIKPYLLYVGNAYPHKNLEKLVDSFGMIQKEIPELKLVMVGREDYFFRRLKKYVRQSKISSILFTGYVSDCELDSLYKNASVYVFPSLYEGFGLPPLEAMAKGVPVVSSDHPCMREVLGEGAYFADAKNPAEFSRAIVKVFRDEKLRQALIICGYKQSGKYSWKKLAEQTYKIYQKIAQK
jgi:glycosyltransferase involved in cell wall biosynthesis